METIKFIGSSRGTNSTAFASLQLAEDYKRVYLSAADTEDKRQSETSIMNVLLSVVIQESFLLTSWIIKLNCFSAFPTSLPTTPRQTSLRYCT